jgi:hypothetical protein
MISHDMRRTCWISVLYFAILSLSVMVGNSAQKPSTPPIFAQVSSALRSIGSSYAVE